jgi:hypothetical protein
MASIQVQKCTYLALILNFNKLTMKQNAQITITILLFCFLVNTCKQDYLVIAPQYSIDENALATSKGVRAAVVASYAMLDGYAGFANGLGYTSSNWIFGSVAADDAHKGSFLGHFPEILQIELFQWLPTNSLLNEKFLSLYEGISRANAALRILKRVNDIDPAEKKSIEGEARFLRVFYHFEAYKMWKYIPYFTEADNDFIKPNKENILPSLIQDLTLAVELLPVDQDAVGKATKGTAQSLLGKILLYDHQFAKAKTQFDAVINSGKYGLSECFHTPLSVPGENNREMIFSCQSSINDGAAEGANSHPDGFNFPFNDGPVGCCGFHQPTQNLVNGFKVSTDGLPLLDDFNAKDLQKDDFVDPRLDWTVGRDGVPYLNWGVHQASWIRDIATAGPYSPKKNMYHKDSGESLASGGWGAQLSSLNVPFIRYSDVLLMAAECEVEIGNLESARVLVNQVRKRAGNCVQGEGTRIANIATSINDPKITWAKYKVEPYMQAWKDQTYARKAVRFERRLELAMEGHRLFDLRRWGVAKEVINTFLQVEKTKRDYLKSSAGYQDRHDLFPLPSIQIELSKVNGVPKLVQNPGF